MNIREDVQNFGFVMENISQPYNSVQFFTRRWQWEMSPHTHPYYQLIYVTSGKLVAECAAGVFVLQKGQVHVLPPNFWHSLRSDGYEQLGVDINTHSDVRELMPLLNNYIPSPVAINCPEVLPDIQEMREKCMIGNRVSVARTVSLLDSVVLKCIEAHTRAGFERFDRQLSNYINQRLDKKIALKEVAEEFHLSIPHLERLARKHFSLSVIELHNQRRLTQACLLLMSTELSIAEIAEKVGFCDQSYFSTFFRQRMKVAPSQYRKNANNSAQPESGVRATR